MCTMSVPVITLNISPERCSEVPTPEDAKAYLPGSRFSSAMSSGTGGDGQRVVDDQQVGKLADHRHRREVAQVIERQLGIERGIDRVRRHRDPAERVAVRRRARHFGNADVAARTRLVVEIERLAEVARQHVAEDAALEVGRAAGRERQDEPHRPRGPQCIVRPRAPRDRQRGARGEQPPTAEIGDCHEFKLVTVTNYWMRAPEARTTSPRRLISARTKAPNSAGVLPSGSMPSEANLSRSSGMASTASVSLLSRWITGSGVPAGAARPNQAETSKPLRPWAASGVTSGSDDSGFSEVRPSAFSLPALTWLITVGALAKVIATSPASAALIASGVDLNGMCCSFTWPSIASTSPERCIDVPVPPEA